MDSNGCLPGLDWDPKSTPCLRIASLALSGILRELCARPAETGGILLGPRGRMEVTEFVFDEGGSCSDVTYSPDVVTLKRRLIEEWMPRGLDWKGFAHSHPGGFDCLSGGDMAYIQRLLRNPNNHDLDFFVAPIVIPEEFRLVPYVVQRLRPHEQRIAELIIT